MGNNEAQGGLGHRDNTIINATLVKWYAENNVKIVRIGDSLSSDTCLVIDDKGQCYGHGLNNNGQLGVGTTTKYSSPQKITFFNDKTVVDVSCAYKWNCWVTADGKVYTSGYDEYGGLGFSNVKTKVTSPTLVDKLLD